MSTAIHEASHCAAAIMLGRPVDHTWLETGHTFAGETMGHANVPLREKVEASQVVVCLAGYMSENRAGWPPSYEDALDEDREALGLVLLKLGVTEEAYEEFIKLTRDLLADEDFIRLRDCIARALSIAKRLDRGDIEALCRATHIPIPQEEIAA